MSNEPQARETRKRLDEIAHGVLDALRQGVREREKAVLPLVVSDNGRVRVIDTSKEGDKTDTTRSSDE